MTISLFLTIAAACNKHLEVDPPITQVTGASAFQSNSTAIAVLNGIYSETVYSNYQTPGTIPSLSVYAGLSGDELTLWQGVTDSKKIAYYQNKLSVNSSTTAGSEYWSTCYALIYRCNSAIEGLNATEALGETIRNQLLGEAKFMRAFFYFHMVNLYGECPLVLNTDFKKAVNLPKSGSDQIYNQIISDLKEAEDLLDEKYLNGYLQPYAVGNEQRVRPTKWAASALLSKAYLYKKDYTSAELLASKVIANTILFELLPLNDVFKMNSREAIFQLQPVNSGVSKNTQDGFFFVIPDGGPNDDYLGNPVYLSNFLLDSFEEGDQRKTDWINSKTVGSQKYYYPFKYKINSPTEAPSEYTMVLRLSEQYLIRAEARANTNKLAEAISDINKIRERARSIPNVDVQDPLPNLPTTLSSQDVIRAVMHERHIELFTEMGNRWFDLKRSGNLGQVMEVVCPTKGGIWNNNWGLYPIPNEDILKAPQITQNNGY